MGNLNRISYSSMNCCGRCFLPKARGDFDSFVYKSRCKEWILEVFAKQGNNRHPTQWFHPRRAKATPQVSYPKKKIHSLAKSPEQCFQLLVATHKTVIYAHLPSCEFHFSPISKTLLDDVITIFNFFTRSNFFVQRVWNTHQPHCFTCRNWTH